MAKVLIKKLDPSVELPAYKTAGASGMDLKAFILEQTDLDAFGPTIDAFEDITVHLECFRGNSVK